MCLPNPKLTRRQSFGLAASALIASQLKLDRLDSVDLGSGLRVFPRDSWGSDLQPVGPLAREDTVSFLLVHHTAGASNYSSSSVVEQIRGVYRFHTGPEKRWNDVCYNFFIDRFGGVWEGRAGSLEGPIAADATGGSQGFAQLICLLGNFQENRPTIEMLDSLVLTLAWLASRYEIDPSPGQEVAFISRGSNRWPAGTNVVARTISGHRDMSQTVCPGDFVYPLLESEVPTQVTKLLRSRFTPTPSSVNDVGDQQSMDPTVEEQLGTVPLPGIEGPTGTETSGTPPTSSTPPVDQTETFESTPSPTPRDIVTEVATAVAVTAATVGVVAAGVSANQRRRHNR